MTTETIDPRDLYYLVKRNLGLFSSIVVLFAAIALVLAFTLPKQYKSHAELNIQTSYFQDPLVNEVITGIDNPAELMAQRMSLLRLAINEEFVDGLATEFGIYSAGADAAQRAVEREIFREKIEYYSLSSSAYQISVIANDPLAAQELTKRVLERMQEVLIRERSEKLVGTRAALDAHVRVLAKGLKNLSGPEQPTAIQHELEQTEATLAGLLLRFTDKHPDVTKMRRQAERLRLQVERNQAVAAKVSEDKPAAQEGIEGLLIAEAAEPGLRIYSDLLEKLSHLNIVLDLERDKSNVQYLSVIEEPTVPIRAIFPNKRMFLLIGLGMGILTAIVMTVVVEVRRSTFISPAAVAEALGGPLLGELPRLIPTEPVTGRLYWSSRLLLPGAGR